MKAISPLQRNFEFFREREKKIDGTYANKNCYD